MNEATLFPAFPDDARLWIHVADRALTDPEQNALLDRLAAFIKKWTTHGRPVTGNATVLDDRFLALAATLAEGDISGCGIDAATHAVTEAADALDITWVPALHVVFRDTDGRIQHGPRSAFRAHVQQGAVTTETPVFDPSITTLGAFRQGRFERPARASWHARVFDLPTPA